MIATTLPELGEKESFQLRAVCCCLDRLNRSRRFSWLAGAHRAPQAAFTNRRNSFTRTEFVAAGRTWSAKAIYVYKPEDLPAKVYRLDLSTGHKILWKDLMPSDSAGVSRIGPILLTTDGKSCLYGYHRILSDLYLVEGLK